MPSKIVFDTNILISATLWEDSVAQKSLFKCIKENIQIFSSQEIIEEYQEILKRDFDYSDEGVEKVTKEIIQFLTLIKPNTKLDLVKEDSDDNKILECAVDSNSELILTYDNHLLKLKDFQGIKIIKPENFLFSNP